VRPVCELGWYYRLEIKRFDSMEERLRQGMILYDVGAEHGWCSSIYAKFVGPSNMVLIEPSAALWPNIRMTWEGNSYAMPAGCCQAFLADTPGDSNLFLLGEWPSCAMSFVECPVDGTSSLAQDYDTPRLALDDLAHKLRPDAVTIDVEGSEMLVLKGAEWTLRQVRPTIWCSVHPDQLERFGSNKESLLQFITSHNYSANLLEIDHEEHWLFLPQ